MIVAVAAVRMMEVAVNQVIDVIAVRDRRVAASRKQCDIASLPTSFAFNLAYIDIQSANQNAGGCLHPHPEISAVFSFQFFNEN